MTWQPLLTIEEVARILAVSRNTVRRMVARGELVGVRVGQRQVRVPPEALRAYIDRGMTPPR